MSTTVRPRDGQKGLFGDASSGALELRVGKTRRRARERALMEGCGGGLILHNSSRSTRRPPGCIRLQCFSSRESVMYQYNVVASNVPMRVKLRCLRRAASARPLSIGTGGRFGRIERGRAVRRPFFRVSRR
jgi:hypothetical protein